MLFLTSEGASGARRHSADGLYDAFHRAIRAGRFARLSSDEIQAIFHQALIDTDGQAARESGGAT